LRGFADIAFVIFGTKALGDDAWNLDPPPARHAVDFPVWAGLDNLGELGQLLLSYS
jgi:hypothetical protein